MKKSLTLLVSFALGSNPGLAQVQDLGATFLSNSTADSISDDGTVIGGRDSVDSMGVAGTAFVWTETDGRTELLSPPWPFDVSRVLSLHVSGDGMSAAGTSFLGQGRSVARWDLSSGSSVLIPGATSVQALSSDGSVLVGAIGSSPSQRPYRWTQAGGTLSIQGPSFGNSFATDVSNDGNVVVGLASGGRPFRWTLTGGPELLSGFQGVGDYGVQVSGDGAVVAGTTRLPNSSTRAFRWTSTGGFQLLGEVSAGASVQRHSSINQDGSVLTGTEDLPSSSGSIVWRWTPTSGITQLGSLSGLLPTGLSDDGTALSLQDTGAGRPARWTAAAGLESLPTFGTLPSQYFGEALGISADGSTIYGRCQLASLSQHGALWRGDGGLGRSLCGPGVPNSSGMPGRLRLTGSDRLDRGAVLIEASGLPPGAFGFVIVSTLEGFVPGAGSSQGNLCLAGPIGRFVGPGAIQMTDSAGRFSLTVDPRVLAQPTGPVAPSYGEAWYFQAWHRDANPNLSSNFTDAATVRFY